MPPPDTDRPGAHRIMLVVQLVDPVLRRAALRAARDEEDVVMDPALIPRALDWARPRAVIHDGTLRRRGRYDHPTIELTGPLVRRWEAEARRVSPGGAPEHFYAKRLRASIPSGGTPAGADRILALLDRAAGRRLPDPLRGFARRVLEFPVHYRTLRPIAEGTGITRGALKARFRRRELPSPSSYLRWLRAFAVADVLAETDVTVAVAARRCGYTSDGNLCRALANLAGVTPTELRTSSARSRLLIRFAWTHLGEEPLDGWAELGELFRRHVA